MLQNNLLTELQTIQILDSIGDPISIQDTSFKVIYQNKRHRETVGDKVGEFFSRHGALGLLVVPWLVLALLPRVRVC